jgi:hypothetical protein
MEFHVYRIKAPVYRWTYSRYSITAERVLGKSQYRSD